MFQGGVDLAAVDGDLAGEVDKSGYPTAPRPGEPPVEGLLAGVALHDKDVAQPLFEQIGAVEAGVGLGDPGKAAAWWTVRFSGFFTARNGPA